MSPSLGSLISTHQEGKPQKVQPRPPPAMHPPPVVQYAGNPWENPPAPPNRVKAGKQMSGQVPVQGVRGPPPGQLLAAEQEPGTDQPELCTHTPARPLTPARGTQPRHVAEQVQGGTLNPACTLQSLPPRRVPPGCPGGTGRISWRGAGVGKPTGGASLSSGGVSNLGV